MIPRNIQPRYCTYCDTPEGDEDRWLRLVDIDGVLVHDGCYGDFAYELHEAKLDEANALRREDIYG